MPAKRKHRGAMVGGGGMKSKTRKKTRPRYSRTKAKRRKS